jgi:hypothetical protein
LPNAEGAGYFDSLGGGEYRLNAIGYNLVNHSMPRGAVQSPGKRKPTNKKKQKR